MKILVTGAAGFIGSHSCERFLELGHEVVGIDNFSSYYSKNLKEFNAKQIREKGVALHQLDLVDDDLSQAVQGVNVVFHFAAQPGVSKNTPFEQYLRNNFLATHRVLEAVRNLSTFKFFVNISTSSVYGHHATESEESAVKPVSYYGVTKLAAEQLVMSQNREGGLPACSLRLFSVYGPRERPGKLYPKVCRSILEEYEFPFYDGSENHQRSYTYVGDVMDGFEKVLQNFDKCNGEIFNFGTDKSVSTGEGIWHVENALGGKSSFHEHPKRKGDQVKTQANIDKARETLGYDPQTSTKEGLKKEAEWYKNHIWNKLDIF